MNSELSHPDVATIARFSSRSRLEKSLNGLLGLIEGITLDRSINDLEVRFLTDWLREHADVADRHPYNEIVPLLVESLEDGKITEEERQDVRWLCERLRATEFTDSTTADMQRLHAIVGGIAADGEVNAEEIRQLSEWLQAHEHLKTCWPFDEVDSLITCVLRDGRLDEQEHAVLRSYFAEFVHKLDDRTITNPPIRSDKTVGGLCAVCPEIRFQGSIFCFTGASSRYSRAEFLVLVEKLGGQGAKSISARVNYLVIGSAGNPCWTYACYGRKVEQAVELRKGGSKIMIVHENDFHDALADL